MACEHPDGPWQVKAIVEVPVGLLAKHHANFQVEAKSKALVMINDLNNDGVLGAEGFVTFNVIFRKKDSIIRFFFSDEPTAILFKMKFL